MQRNGELLCRRIKAGLTAVAQEVSSKCTHHKVVSLSFVFSLTSIYLDKYMIIASNPYSTKKSSCLFQQTNHQRAEKTDSTINISSHLLEFTPFISPVSVDISWF